MKYRIGWIIFLFHICTVLFSQDKQEENSLLWRISGNGLPKTSYLFGTLHSLCRRDASLSDSVRFAIKTSEKVYLEIDQTDRSLKQIQSLMKMQNDTTFADLLNEKDYESLKRVFKKNDKIIPFSILKKYKPYLAYNLLPAYVKYCITSISMEKLIVRQAKRNNKPIAGLETVEELTAIFDELSYKTQAEELVKRINMIGDRDEAKVKKIWDIYENQNLGDIEKLIELTDIGLPDFLNGLIYNRNHKWAEQLQTLLPKESLLIAVGVWHLPGQKGLINLLRQKGYTVEPIKN